MASFPFFAGLLFFSTLAAAQSCSDLIACEPGLLCIDRFCVNLNATTANDDTFFNSTKSRF